MSGGLRLPRVDRRTTLKWLAATMAAAQLGCSRDEKFVGNEIPATGGKLPSATGYGKDPNLMQPAVPWPLTLAAAELAAVAALADVILPADERSPAASALGVPDFIDEWVSAPYPQQVEDRATILAGLAWLDDRSRARNGTAFADADEPLKLELVGRVARENGEAPPQPPAGFFRRFRYLAVGAYYTTEAGMRDIGYVGNVAIAGPYPGPSDEALAHLTTILERLDLE